jgi:hypothetical protein
MTHAARARGERERTGSGDGVDEEAHAAKGADLFVVVEFGRGAGRPAPALPEGPPRAAAAGLERVVDNQERSALAAGAASDGSMWWRLMMRWLCCVLGFTTTKIFYVSVVVDRHDGPREEKSPVLRVEGKEDEV